MKKRQVKSNYSDSGCDCVYVRTIPVCMDDFHII